MAVTALLVSFISVDSSMAAIAFVAQASANNGNGANTLTINKPAGTVSGHVMIATVTTRTTGAFTAPTGWTSVLDSTATNIHQITYYKVAGASEPANYSWTWTGATRRASGGIVDYSGVDNTSPVDVSASGTGASGNASVPNVTTAASNDRIVVAVSTSKKTTYTPASGTTERYDDGSTGTNGTTNEAADIAKAAPGAFEPPNLTVNPASSTNSWIAHTVALQETESITATFPSNYTFATFTVGGPNNLSGEQTESVLSNRGWGTQLSSDQTDGKMKEYDGSSYLTNQLGNSLNWRMSSLDGVSQPTPFAPISSTPSLIVGGRPANTVASTVGVTYNQVVDYSDDPNSGTNVYRIVVTFNVSNTL